MEKTTAHRRKKSLIIALGVLLVYIGITVIWFHIPYSPLSRQFSRDVSQRITDNAAIAKDIFTEKDFENLPPIIQKYINYCGYISKPKMSFIRAD